MKKTKDVEIRKYNVTDDTYILLEHNTDSDAYFATVIAPDHDFSIPLYSFNNASLFYLRHNPSCKFKSFEEAIQYIETTDDVQYELKTFVPDYVTNEDNDPFAFDDLDADFPLGSILEFKAKLLTDQWTAAEMKQMLRTSKEKILEMTDDVITDQFVQSKKKIDHSAKTEYNRLMFLYTTFNDTLDEEAKSDVDNVLSLIYSKKIRIQQCKYADLIYSKIAEVLTVYDDVFSEKNNTSQMTLWVKKSIANVLKLYHII